MKWFVIPYGNAEHLELFCIFRIEFRVIHKKSKLLLTTPSLPRDWIKWWRVWKSHFLAQIICLRVLVCRITPGEVNAGKSLSIAVEPPKPCNSCLGICYRRTKLLRLLLFLLIWSSASSLRHRVMIDIAICFEYLCQCRSCRLMKVCKEFLVWGVSRPFRNLAVQAQLIILSHLSCLSCWCWWPWFYLLELGFEVVIFALRSFGKPTGLDHSDGSQSISEFSNKVI
jgi:hypothetical protein